MVRSFLFGAVVLVVVAFGLVAAGATFWTDMLWFQNLGLVSVFWTKLTWEWAIKFGAGLVFALFLFGNLLVAKPALNRLSQSTEEVVPKVLVGRWVNWLFAGFSAVLGFIYSAGVGGIWEDVLLYLKRSSFGETDPIFGRDIGYYMFSLPFFEVLYRAVQGLVVVSLLVVGIIYLVTKAVSFEDGRLSMGRRSKAHLSILLAGLFALKAWSYFLNMYQLVYSPRGVVFGASYTDVYAYALGLRALAVIAVIAALTLLFNIFRPGLRLTVISVVLLLVASPLLGTLYPSLVQRFVVEPNELVKETPFIEHNVEFTRKAYGLGDIDEQAFAADQSLTYDELMQNEATVNGVRLWDWRPLLQVYSQLQEMRLYYQFKEVDIDRYTVDGQYRQVMLAARELNPERVQNRTWINQRLQYTHGYGAVVSPVNEVTPEGLPKFFVSDVPPVSRAPELSIDRPEIYYGELANDYVIVNSRTPEFDYPKGENNAQVRYAGQGGVPLSNLLVKLAFAVRMADTKVLISGELTNQSRVMLYRNIMERVNRIAPFFRYDADPYLVISKGKLYWILDGYTTSNNYPYSTPSRGWGNYVRNSVKVVIDAYHGDVSFYRIDTVDPLAAAYAEIFPGLLRDIEEMDPDLRAHLRYPEDLFTLQANVYSSYHMENPTVFYNREDLWNIPQEIVGASPTTMEPYYVIMELPGSDEPEMVLMLPFTPAKKNNMVAWMAARNDGEEYGKLLVYKFPKQELTYGPMQIEARIDQDSEISQLITLWSQKGSSVYRGNLLVIPVERSLLYVEPIYLQAEQSRLPELKRVIAAVGSRVVMADNLDEAFRRLFNVEAQNRPQPEKGVPMVPESQDVSGLISQAVRQYNRAQEQLKAGDWGGYGESMAELEDTLRTLENWKPQAPTGLDEEKTGGPENPSI